jgi:uncharacterized protein
VTPTTTLTWTYREFDITNPSSWVFDIDDISQALSNQCRFNGHIDFYSVAEHSVYVSEILEKDGALLNTIRMGLLHDAAEAYIGDIPGPWKHLLRVGTAPLSEIEKQIELRIFERFGVTYNDVEWAEVKAADKAAYTVEAASRPAPGKGWDPTQSRYEFLKRHRSLLT